MQYVKFATIEEAEAYLPKLQAHYNATVNQDKTQPKVISCIFRTWDGKVAVTFATSTWSETTGEVVDNVDRPLTKDAG